jgi:hypothetical protein
MFERHIEAVKHARLLAEEVLTTEEKRRLDEVITILDSIEIPLREALSH